MVLQHLWVIQYQTFSVSHISVAEPWKRIIAYLKLWLLRNHCVSVRLKRVHAQEDNHSNQARFSTTEENSVRCGKYHHLFWSPKELWLQNRVTVTSRSHKVYINTLKNCWDSHPRFFFDPQAVKAIGLPSSQVKVTQLPAWSSIIHGDTQKYTTQQLILQPLHDLSRRSEWDPTYTWIIKMISNSIECKIEQQITHSSLERAIHPLVGLRSSGAPT